MLFSLAMYWNQILELQRKNRTLGTTPEELYMIGLSINIFKSFPDDFNMQKHLRTIPTKAHRESNNLLLHNITIIVLYYSEYSYWPSF